MSKLSLRGSDSSEAFCCCLSLTLPDAVERSFDGYQAIDWWTSNDRLMPSERFPKYYQNSFPIIVVQAFSLLPPDLILYVR